MSTLDDVADSPWSWWERRRLAYNIALFIVGWLGFGLQVSAIALWGREPADIAYMALWQGLIYVFYMAAANVLYLLGPVVEAVVKPRPVDGYRRLAWAMGLGLSVGLPLVTATVFALTIGWPSYVG